MLFEHVHEAPRDHASSGTQPLNDSWFNLRQERLGALEPPEAKPCLRERGIGDPLADSWFR